MRLLPAQLDKDGSGQLASFELVDALTRLQSDSKTKNEREQKQLALVSQCKKASEQTQLKAKALRMVKPKGMFEGPREGRE